MENDVDDYHNLSAQEFGFQMMMDHRLHLLSLRDIVSIGMLTRATNRMYPPYLQQIVHKISVSNDEYGRIEFDIFAKGGREVFGEICSVRKIEGIMSFLRRMGVSPQELDLKHYDHEPADPVIEYMHKITTYREISLHPSCSCLDGCLELNNFTLSDIYSISPQTFLSFKKKYSSSDKFQGLNSLHLNASLLSKCSDIVEIQAAYNTKQKQPPHAFIEELNCLTRLLYINGTNRYLVDRKTLETLILQLRVEELHLTPEYPSALDDEQFSYKWSRFNNLRELHFANLPRFRFWSDHDPKIRVNKVFYVASERGVIVFMPALIVQKICSWFQTKKETNISFEKPRSCEALCSDLKSMFPILMDVDLPLLTMTFICALYDEQPIDRSCNAIVKCFRDEDYFIVPSSWRQSENWFQFDVKKRSENIIRLFISFVREPPKPEERDNIQLFRQGLELLFQLQ